jgi:ApbE superfamily uncharacterized protein (UPF0280 family)
MEQEKMKVCMLRQLPKEMQAEAMQVALKENPDNASEEELASLKAKRWKPGRTLKVHFMGGDSFLKSSYPLDIRIYAGGSPIHDKLILALPLYKGCFGVSTYAPGKGVNSVTVISRSACWASAFATDIGIRLIGGEKLASVLNRAADYTDVGGVILIAGGTVVVGGEMVLKSVNGTSEAQTTGR